MRRRSGKPSLAPLIAFVFLCAVVGGGGYIYLNARRLGDLEQISSVAPVPETPVVTPASPEKKPVPVALPQPEPGVVEKPVEAPAPPPAVAEVGHAEADHEFIAQTEAPAAETKPVVINDVVIEPVRKTWVTVRSGDASSTPIFEDFLYANAPSLKLRGPRFFIEVRDEGAVNIRKNGAPIAYQGAGVTIQ